MSFFFLHVISTYMDTYTHLFVSVQDKRRIHEMANVGKLIYLQNCANARNSFFRGVFHPDALCTPCSENRNRKVTSAAGDTGVFIHRRKDILIGLLLDPVAIFFAESYVYTMVSQSWSGEVLSRQNREKEKK